MRQTALSQAAPREAHRLLAARFVFITGGAFTDRARAFAQRMEGRLLHKPFTAAAVRALLQSPSAA